MWTRLSVERGTIVHLIKWFVAFAAVTVLVWLALDVLRRGA